MISVCSRYSITVVFVAIAVILLPAAGISGNAGSLAGGSSAKLVPAAADKGAAFGGITVRIGMTKTEVMTQMSKHPEAGWYVPELDSPPTGELHKMDKWLLAYKTTTGPTPGGGTVTLYFVNDKVSSIEAGGDRK